MITRKIVKLPANDTLMSLNYALSRQLSQSNSATSVRHQERFIIQRYSFHKERYILTRYLFAGEKLEFKVIILYRYHFPESMFFFFFSFRVQEEIRKLVRKNKKLFTHAIISYKRWHVCVRRMKALKNGVS